jgi:hypothetical protein
VKGIGVVGIVFIVFIVAAGAYAYVSYVAPQPQGGALTMDFDAATDAIYVRNFGSATSMVVFVDGREVQSAEELSGDTGIITLQEPLQAGEHTLMVRAGTQTAEQRVVVEERWTVDFDISASR